MNPMTETAIPVEAASPDRARHPLRGGGAARPRGVLPGLLLLAGLLAGAAAAAEPAWKSARVAWM